MVGGTRLKGGLTGSEGLVRRRGRLCEKAKRPSALPHGGEKNLLKCWAIRSQFGFHGRMQFRQSQLKGDRPVCPTDSKHIVHGNGSYTRRRNPDGDEEIRVPCWNCTQCSNSFSVLPDDMVPYRPIRASLLESGLNCELNGLDPPERTEKEKGCLNRAVQSFITNTPFLANKLGQMIKLIRPSAAELWQELRGLGDMTRILGDLAEYFKTSLLKNYRCLHPLIRGQRAPCRSALKISAVP